MSGTDYSRYIGKQVTFNLNSNRYGKARIVEVRPGRFYHGPNAGQPSPGRVEVELEVIEGTSVARLFHLSTKTPLPAGHRETAFLREQDLDRDHIAQHYCG